MAGVNKMELLCGRVCQGIWRTSKQSHVGGVTNRCLILTPFLFFFYPLSFLCKKSRARTSDSVGNVSLEVAKVMGGKEPSSILCEEERRPAWKIGGLSTIFFYLAL